ncbi:hypothetical protein [Cytobacillus sp. FSL K6-0265]|uniref:hypothetical protein n=1 Tax=Cytobacillus sp. FSL K6-0265 TaxID=2921448 RepID=UPI0030FD0F3D
MTYAPWQEPDDQLLEELVNEYSQNGDSKADAFRMAAKKLGRTESACQTRYHTMKKNREDSAGLSIQKVIEYLKTTPDLLLLSENKALILENEQLEARNKELNQKWEETSHQLDNELSLYEGLMTVMKEYRK